MKYYYEVLSSSLTTREQGEALVKWKNSLSSPFLIESWSLANLDNHCNWTGIICNSAGSVSVIDLSGKRLTGTLAEFDFSLLSNLNNFTVGNNNFTGSIPPDIEKMIDLQYLDFSYNHLNGFIPYQVSHLQKLCTLNLRENQFEAPKWSRFFRMPFLNRLDLASNNLESKFPEFISSCQKLTYLDLSANFLTGDLVPESVFNNLHNLEYLLISDNSFEGPFPPNIISLSKLRFLYLYRNNFSGCIPHDIRMPCNLKYIRLSSNSFEGNFPSFTLLWEIQILDLAENHFNSSIPRELGLLTNAGAIVLQEIFLRS